jgi:hypothetical protein
LEIILVSSDRSSSRIVIKAIRDRRMASRLRLSVNCGVKKVEPRSCWGHDRLDWVFAPFGKIPFDPIERSNDRPG